MSNYKDPNAVVDFIYNDGSFGSAHEGEFECIRKDDVNYFLHLEDDVWSLSTTMSGNHKLREAVFNQLAHPATEVLGTEYGEEYEFVIQCPAGFKQLVSTGGYAELLDP